MTLTVDEFIRRWRLHPLPPRFVKIRHYGLLANRGRQERLRRARELLGVSEAPALCPPDASFAKVPPVRLGDADPDACALAGAAASSCGE